MSPAGPLGAKYKITSLETGEVLDPATCFVIRDTDVFAAQALWGYAHLVQSALELDALPFRNFLTIEEKRNLQDLIESLSALADKWKFKTKKVPT